MLKSFQESDKEMFLSIGKLIVLGSIAYIGKRASDLNDTYSREKLKPDFTLRFSKAAAIGSLLFACDILGDTNTKLNFAKLGAFSLSCFAVTDKVGDLTRHIPVVGGILTDPINTSDHKGGQYNDVGMFLRGLLAYIPLRNLAIQWATSYAHI